MKKKETIAHVLGGCHAIPFNLLKARHDAVVLQVANEIITFHKLGDKLSLYDTGNRVSRNSKDFKLVLDQRVMVVGDKHKTVQMPDIICIDKKRKRITIIEVGISAEDLAATKEEEKTKKYLQAAKMLEKRYKGYKAECRAIVIGQLGVISWATNLAIIKTRKSTLTKKDDTRPKRHVDELIAKILNVTIKGSLEIYRWFMSDAPTPHFETRSRAPALYAKRLAELKKSSSKTKKSPENVKLNPRSLMRAQELKSCKL